MVNWWRLGRQAASAAGILHTGFGVTNKALYTYRNVNKGLNVRRAKYYPKPDFRLHSQYNRFISGRRRFRIRQRRGYTRRRYRPRSAYRSRSYGGPYSFKRTYGKDFQRYWDWGKTTWGGPSGYRLGHWQNRSSWWYKKKFPTSIISRKDHYFWVPYSRRNKPSRQADTYQHGGHI